MVASISALGRRGGTADVADIAEYFTGLVTADYYTDSGEPPGAWFGAGAGVLGLTGQVDKQRLMNVLCGRSPDNHKQLVTIQKRKQRAETPQEVRESGGRAARRQAKRRDRCPGFDVTLSVPKSVSAMWAVTSLDIRRAIDQCIETAARDTLTWLETSVPLARRGKGGSIHEYAKLVVAMFHHSVPRNVLEPQRHVHCLIANMCQREDGSWATVNGRKLMEWTRTLGPIFRANLAAELQRQLGIELARPKDGKGKELSWFEIKDVPERLLSHWSSRRGQIEELLRDGGFEVDQSTAQARQKANLDLKPVYAPCSRG